MSDACAVFYSETLIIPTEGGNGSIYNLLTKITEKGIPPENEDDVYNYDLWKIGI